MPLTALVVEDDPSVFETIRETLEVEGIDCLGAPDGPTALEMVVARRPDLVVLDVKLPGLSGLEVCRRIRQNPVTSRLPIIIVSALGAEADHVRGLEIGADDYVSKPFGVRELLARVRAVLRRSAPPAEPSPWRFGGLEIDVGKRRVTLHGAPVALTRTEFGLLEALIRAGGQGLSRSQLLAAVRGYAKPEEIESRTIDVHLGRLRAKLGSEAPRLVTLRGFGYRFDTGA